MKRLVGGMFSVVVASITTVLTTLGASAAVRMADFALAVFAFGLLPCVIWRAHSRHWRRSDRPVLAVACLPLLVWLDVLARPADDWPRIWTNAVALAGLFVLAWWLLGTWGPRRSVKDMLNELAPPFAATAATTVLVCFLVVMIPLSFAATTVDVGARATAATTATSPTTTTTTAPTTTSTTTTIAAATTTNVPATIAPPIATAPTTTATAPPTTTAPTTTTTPATTTGASDLSWNEACPGIPLPGNNESDKKAAELVYLYLGPGHQAPGGKVAGCTIDAKPLPGHPGVDYVIGQRGGAILSRAVVWIGADGKAGGGIAIEPWLPFFWSLVRRYGEVTVSERIDVLNKRGDVVLMNDRDGTTSLVRTSKSEVPTELGPVATARWAQAMTQFDEPLWPVPLPDRGGMVRFKLVDDPATGHEVTVISYPKSEKSDAPVDFETIKHLTHGSIDLGAH